MKKTRLLFFALPLLLCAGCAARPTPTPIPSPPTPFKDWTITAQWQYDFTNTPGCSATLNTGCVTGFTWGYLKGATQVPLKTLLLPVVACSPAPITPPCVDITTIPLTYHDQTNGVVGIGPVTPYVVANGLDNNGVAVTSVTDLGPVDNVAIGVPTNAGWTRK